MSLDTPLRHSLAHAWRLSLALGGVLGCGGDAVVTLGGGAPVPEIGDTGQRVRNLNELASTELGATLTEDLLEIYFVSDREGGLGGSDVWRAQRSARSDPFGAPEPALELSSSAVEASPAISPDGLTLWLASDREPGLGQMDVWRATRGAREQPWSAPENVAALNSPFDDIPHPPGAGGAVLPIASDREGGPYQVYLAHGQAAGFDDARLEPLTYLWQTDAGMDDPFLSWDGRLLFFRRAALDGQGDLYVAWRRQPEAQFIDPTPLPLVNSDADERDPFLSSDQIRFFFSSNQRDAMRFDIYATSIALPQFE